jgi:hypothetical protein
MFSPGAQRGGSERKLAWLPVPAEEIGDVVAKPFHEYTQANYDAVTGVNLVPGWPCARDTVGAGSALPVTWRVTCHLDR